MLSPYGKHEPFLWILLTTTSILTIAAQLMGFRTYIPPSSRARGLELLRGVNYASGAAGIRQETGDNLVYICNCMYL